MPKSRRQQRRQRKRQRKQQRRQLRRQLALQYTYEPITADYTTRILTLYNGAYKDQLTGDLEMAKLDDCPPWRALSYKWGTTTTYSKIKIGDSFIKISTNLDGALRRLRDTNGDRAPGRGFRLWVDQICINQENVQERSQQVQLMYNIYEKAEQVCVWLGPDQDDAALKAFSALRLIVSLDKERLESILDEGPEAFVPSLGLEHLKVLLDLPWFTRLWIIQEVGTDAPVEFYWGQECVSFDILYEACRILLRNRSSLARMARIRYMTPIRVYKSFVERAETTRSQQHADFAFQLHLFNRASRKDCLDPKDRVFALLGHYSARIGPGKHPIMQADYSSTETAVYRELAVRALTDAKSTFILNAVQHKEYITIPSWVPNWNGEALHYSIGFVDFGGSGAAGSSPLDAQIMEPRTTLQIQGFAFDVIERTSRQFRKHGNIELSSRHGSEKQHIIEQVWYDFCGHATFDMLVDNQATGSSDLVAFLDTCVALWPSYYYNAKLREDFLPLTPNERARSGTTYLCRRPTLGQMSNDTGALGSTRTDSTWAQRFRDISSNRRFAITVSGYYALCPHLVEKGDLVVVLMGYKTPFILRPTGDDFLLVGECYVHGIMQGQALDMLDKGEKELRIFNIR